jgi:hypothetical protein
MKNDVFWDVTRRNFPEDGILQGWFQVLALQERPNGFAYRVSVIIHFP